MSILAEKVHAAPASRVAVLLWWAGFLASLVLPVTTLAFLAGGPKPWHEALLWTLPVWTLIAADHCSPALTRDPPKGLADWPFDLLLCLLAALQFANVIALAAFAAQTQWQSAGTVGVSLVNLLAARILTGTNSCCAAIAPAHELIHRRSRFMRLLGRLLLWTVFYDHFAIAHARFHHRRWGTRRDPSIARPGESYRAFLLRTLPAQFRLAWRADARGVLIGLAGETLLAVLIAVQFGWVALAMFFYQAAVAVRLLEAVNYFQHWGLQAKDASHPVAWVGASAVSQFLFLGLPRHSAHHRRAGETYPRLRFDPDGPRLPYGYLWMAVLVKNADRRYQTLAGEQLREWRVAQG
ncbi:MAG TPA: fatty acid desaturase [Methylococcaceae bacterium]|nr:fatty acid desaturase [Methylococcaceae bacterium]